VDDVVNGKVRRRSVVIVPMDDDRTEVLRLAAGTAGTTTVEVEVEVEVEARWPLE
jgi:hypothetical protein